MKNPNERLIRAEMLDAQALLGAASILATRIVTALCTNDIDDQGLIKQYGVLVARVEGILAKLRNMPIATASTREDIYSKALYVRVSDQQGPGEIFVEIETADGESVRVPSIRHGRGRVIGPFYLRPAAVPAGAPETTEG